MNTDAKHSEEFYLACMLGDLKKARNLMITHWDRIDYNFDFHCWTPYTAACERGHIHIVRWLHGVLGVDTRDTGRWGRSAFFASCTSGSMDVVSFVYNNTIDINERDYAGITPLIEAADRGHIEVVRFLLKKGAKVNARDKYRHTALYAACRRGHLDIVKELVYNYHVNFHQLDKKKRTPISIARSHRHDSIVEFLQAVETIRLRGWSPERHKHYIPSVRKEVYTLLLLARCENRESELSILPNELFDLVCCFIGWS